MNDQELFKLIRSNYVKVNQEYLIQQMEEAMKYMPKRHKLRKKMYMKYLLKEWSEHKPINVRYDMIRKKDWYRIVELIKRGGQDWFLL